MRGQAIVEYAIVAVLFGLLMLTAMGATRHAAGGNIVSTQSRLTNESNAP